MLNSNLELFLFGKTNPVVNTKRERATLGVTYGTGDGPRTVAIGDLDGDLDLDLAVANQLSDDVSVLLNQCDFCPADLDGSGAVDISDLIAVLTAWGNKGGPEDLDGSGTVDFGDLLIVLDSWGVCDE